MFQILQTWPFLLFFFVLRDLKSNISGGVRQLVRLNKSVKLWWLFIWHFIDEIKSNQRMNWWWTELKRHLISREFMSWCMGSWALLCGVSFYSGFLPQSKDMPIGLQLTGDYKLRCKHECEWLFVPVGRPCDTLATCPGFTPPLAQGRLGLARAAFRVTPLWPSQDKWCR